MASPLFPQPMDKADGRTAAGVAQEPATGAADAAFVPDPAFFAASEEADADAEADADVPAESCDVALDAPEVDEPVEPGTTAGALEAGAVLVAVEVGAAELLLDVDEDEVEEEEELDVDEEEDELVAADDEVAGVVATVVLIVLSAPEEQPAIRTRGMAASAIRFMR